MSRLYNVETCDYGCNYLLKVEKKGRRYGFRCYKHARTISNFIYPPLYTFETFFTLKFQLFNRVISIAFSAEQNKIISIYNDTFYDVSNVLFLFLSLIDILLYL